MSTEQKEIYIVTAERTERDDFHVSSFGWFVDPGEILRQADLEAWLLRIYDHHKGESVATRIIEHGDNYEAYVEIVDSETYETLASGTLRAGLQYSLEGSFDSKAHIAVNEWMGDQSREVLSG